MSIYPNEAWPAETTVLSVDGTVDAGTGLPFIAKGTGPTTSPSYEIQYNRRQMRENKILAACRQGMVVDEGNLRIGIYPLDYTVSGARRTFPGVTGMMVPDNISRVIYLDATESPRVESNWPIDATSYLPLAEITTLNGTMTIVDRRVRAMFAVPTGRRFLSAFCPQVGSNQTGLKVFEFSPVDAMTLEQVQVFCTAAVATVSVDVRQSGTTVLGAPAVPVAGGVVKPAVANPALTAAGAISVHVTTNASGSLSNLHVNFILRGA